MRKRFVFKCFIAAGFYLMHMGVLYAGAWHFDTTKLQIVCMGPEGQIQTEENCLSLNYEGVRVALLTEWLPFVIQLHSELNGELKIEYFLRLNKEILESHYNYQIEQNFSSHLNNIQRINRVLPKSDLTPEELLPFMLEVIASTPSVSTVAVDGKRITRIVYNQDQAASAQYDIKVMLTPYDIIIPLWGADPLEQGSYKKVVRAISLRQQNDQVLVMPRRDGNRNLNETFLHMYNELYVQQKMQALLLDTLPVVVGNYYYINSDSKEIYQVRDYYQDTFFDYIYDHKDFAFNDPLNAVDIALQEAKILQALHQSGFRHKDVKSENFFIDENGKIFLSDFDFTYIVGDPHTEKQRLNLSGSLEHVSPFYMRKFESPASIIEGREFEIDAANDVWGLGVVMFEMLFGRNKMLNHRFFFQCSQAEIDSEVVGSINSMILGNQDPSKNKLLLGLATIVSKVLKTDYREVISIDQLVIELSALKEGAAAGVAAAPPPAVGESSVLYPALFMVGSAILGGTFAILEAWDEL
ncbi:MAG: protein kinase family protein [Oligoflexia bacterium]|nr:protein kinase family protein [Oligoflexia bacterium]